MQLHLCIPFMTAAPADKSFAFHLSCNFSLSCQQLKFDPCEPLMSSSVAAVPPLLYCTSDGALCSAHAAGAAAGNGAANGAAAGGLEPYVHVQESCSINSFDVDQSVGQDILAGTDYECMLLLHRPVEM
jgi:hypothetical protein